MDENPYGSPLSQGEVEKPIDENVLATGLKKLLWMGLVVVGTYMVVAGLVFVISTIEVIVRRKVDQQSLLAIPAGSSLACLGVYIVLQARKRLDFRVESSE